MEWLDLFERLFYYLFLVGIFYFAFLMVARYTDDYKRKNYLVSANGPETTKLRFDRVVDGRKIFVVDE